MVAAGLIVTTTKDSASRTNAACSAILWVLLGGAGAGDESSTQRCSFFNLVSLAVQGSPREPTEFLPAPRMSPLTAERGEF